MTLLGFPALELAAAAAIAGFSWSVGCAVAHFLTRRTSVRLE